MKISRTLSAIGAIATLAGAAHADVKVVQAVTIDNPQFKAAMQSMSPEQRAQMSKMGLGGTILSTLYVSGSKSRTDIGAFNSTLVDQSAGKVTMINRTSHTYSTQPLNAAAGRAKGTTATVKPTGKTKVILGHLCRDYRLSATSASMPGGAISGDIWAAADLPRLPVSSLSGGPQAALQSQWNKIAGMPLQMTITVTGSSIGNTVVRTVARSVSATPIPASVFAIPAGYQPGPAYGNPMMGGMGAGG